MSDTEPTIYVCVRYDGGPLVMTDNVVGACDACGRPIQFRPWAPLYLTSSLGAGAYSMMCVECATTIHENPTTWSN